MKRGTRALAALGLGFVAWRIGVELVPMWIALGLGLITGAATWALSAPKGAVPPS